MSKQKGLLNKHSRTIFWVIIFAVVIYLIVRNVGAFSSVLLTLVGFGAVVLIHEFGHFIAAKSSGIKVEAFSIFMPPILLGVRKTEDGFRFRVLPSFFPKENDESGDGTLSFTVGKKGKAWETEYRIGLIPFGGFVKMLGQDDTGPIKAGDDPRSFVNKPVGTRMAVMTAGVVFNVISATIAFVIVFLIGIKLPPAVVGGVRPGSPAAVAGLMAGDEIIEIAGKSKNLDFSNILIAAALSDANEAVPMKVKREDGSVEDFVLVAKQSEGEQLRVFGVARPKTLTIAEVSEPNKLYSKTGLLPGDRIKSIEGEDVRNYWELAEIVQNTFVPEVTLLAERTDEAGRLKLVESKIRMELFSAGTGHIYSMVPRFRMENIEVQKSLWMKIATKLRRVPEKIGILEEMKAEPFLQNGDIILAIGEVEFPVYEEFREVVKEYEDKKLPIKVLRTDANGIESSDTISVRPKRYADVNEAAIGILFLRMYDAEHPVVAKTIAVEGGPEKLEIPRGASITAVDGVAVSNFYDIIREIRRYPGERITIDYRLNEEIAGDVALNVGDGRKFITLESTFAEFIPFDDLQRLYKADGPVDAMGMGYRKTVMFIAQTYITLRRWIGGLVSPKSFMGPVGIIAFSYYIVTQQPLVYYIYFLSLISAVIAVINFLPLPPLDGGLVVLLLVEKVKGSALSERTQGIIAYTGWALIAALFLYVTFNDIVRTFFS